MELQLLWYCPYYEIALIIKMLSIIKNTKPQIKTPVAAISFTILILSETEVVSAFARCSIDVLINSAEKTPPQTIRNAI